jgi:hypothetical protein
MQKPQNSLSERIAALNVATGFLIPNITGASTTAVINWIKADIAALEQLRAQLRQDDRRAHAMLPSASALDAIIESKRHALHRLLSLAPVTKAGIDGS